MEFIIIHISMITIGISTHIERHSVRVGIQDIIIFTTVMLAELDPVVTDLADLTDTIEVSQEQDKAVIIQDPITEMLDTEIIIQDQMAVWGMTTIIRDHKGMAA
jgi:hypothetical protein